MLGYFMSKKCNLKLNPGNTVILTKTKTGSQAAPNCNILVTTLNCLPGQNISMDSYFDLFLGVQLMGGGGSFVTSA